MSDMAIYRQLLPSDFSSGLGRTEFFPNRLKIVIEQCEEVDEFVVAKERINKIGLRQNVPAPAVQDCDLQEGR
jgi:hypothetical protein